MSFIEDGGPFIATAALCEMVLHERDGVLSAIRIVDRVVTRAGGPGAPTEMPITNVDLKVLLSFKSGTARGNYQINVTPITPSGRALQGFSMPMLLEGEDRGANVIGSLVFQANEEGLYWFDVTVGTAAMREPELVTRMPLRIIYQRVGLGAVGTPVH